VDIKKKGKTGYWHKKIEDNEDKKFTAHYLNKTLITEQHKLSA